MINEKTFPISVDRPSRSLMTAFGAGRKAPRVTMSSSTVNIRMGWAFQATIPREAVARTRATRWGALRERQRSCADSRSLNAIASPATVSSAKAADLRRFLRRHAKTNGIDVETLAACGSAGG